MSITAATYTKKGISPDGPDYEDLPTTEMGLFGHSIWQVCGQFRVFYSQDKSTLFPGYPILNQLKSFLL